MRRPLVGVLAGIVLAGGLGTGAAYAQEDEASRLGAPPVQYNFAPPGARSLAMGAAFIGLADDATASESNPAGLTVLTKPEFSAHLRYSEFDNEVPNTVTGRGFETFTSRVGSPSFFSVVYPWSNAAASIYYQRAADFRNNSEFDGLLNDGVYDRDTVDLLFRTENVGLSAAFKLGDKLSIGGTVRATRVKLDATQAIQFANDPLQFGVSGYLVEAQGSVDETKTKATFNAGILFSPTSKISLGAVYKKGADFDFTQTIQAQLVVPGQTPSPNRSTEPAVITVPDVFGGGLVFRPTDQLTLVADVVSVQYSQADTEARNLYQSSGQGGREDLEDATEIHVGGEYTWAHGNDWLFALRAGAFTDPDHDGLAGLDSDTTHVTFGGGVVVKNAMQVDVAANIADRVKEMLVSFVFRF